MARRLRIAKALLVKTRNGSWVTAKIRSVVTHRPVRLGSPYGSAGDEGGPHDERTEDAVEEDPALVDPGHEKGREDESEDEDAVDGPAEAQPETHPDGGPDGGFAEGHDPLTAMGQPVDREHDQDHR